MPTSTEWIVFLGTAALFAITPGPGILYVLARSLRGGRREGVRSAAGTFLGATGHVAAAALGLSALLATSTVVFAAVKFAGAAYLVFLGLQAILRRHDGDAAEAGPACRFARSPLLQGVLVELLNPKTTLYFLALLPHFVHPQTAPAPLVFLVLGLIALGLASLADVLVAVGAGGLATTLLDHPRWRVRQRVAGGLTMIGLGGFVAIAQ
jgi:threonine/homoserine/homoserine lactone efflux protein